MSFGLNHISLYIYNVKTSRVYYSIKKGQRKKGSAASQLGVKRALSEDDNAE